jgi:GMP synthase (glutamine-hydrolysing)
VAGIAAELGDHEHTRKENRQGRRAEDELAQSGAFQYLAILHEGRVTGVRDGRRDYGFQIEVRFWDSENARTASPTRLPHQVLERLRERIAQVAGVVSVTYNIIRKPASTIEAIRLPAFHASAAA